MSNSLWPHRLQHARPPCPSTPKAYSNSYPLSRCAIQPSYLLLSSSPRAFNLHSIRVFFNEAVLHIRWPKYWSVSWCSQLQQYSNEYPGLISFRMDWLDLLAVHRTLKSLPQQHSTEASILWCSAFFTVQLPLPYMNIGKTRVLTRWTFVSKVMSLLFNVLSRLVIAFLPRSKHPLISWLQSPSEI